MGARTANSSLPFGPPAAVTAAAAAAATRSRHIATARAAIVEVINSGGDGAHRTEAAVDSGFCEVRQQTLPGTTPRSLLSNFDWDTH